MAKTKMWGRISWLVGILGAVILGFLAGAGILEIGALLTTILIIAGIVIGLMNITVKETVPMMVAAMVIGIGSFAALPLVGGYLDSILQALGTVVLPAATVIAFKTIWEKTK